MPRISAVVGSFDLMTLGHLHVIGEALKASDHVHVLIAVSPTKKPFFDFNLRVNLANMCIEEVYPNDVNRVTVDYLPQGNFVARHVEHLGGTAIYRGIRNVVDFEEEYALQLINRSVAPSVSTVFVMPPAELTVVSSSMIKSMRGLSGWEDVVKKYVTPGMLIVLKNWKT